MGIMNFQLFKKIVDEANEIGVGAISLASRGEPTMHKQLPEMLEYAGKKENIANKAVYGCRRCDI